MRFREALRRRGLWAIGATLVVPAVFAVAIATTLLGGSFRQFGAVAQVITGPGIPEAHVSGGTLAGERSRTRLPTVPRLRPERAAGVAAVPGPGARTGVPQVSEGPAFRPATRPVPRLPIPLPALPQVPVPTIEPAPPGQPGSGPVRQAGEQVANTAGGLPAPAGQAGHDAVMTVVDLVDPALRQAPAPLPAKP